MLEIYSQVVLSVALPTLPLKPGARGVVVHVHGAGEAYEVEFMTDDGQTLAVATVPSTHLGQSPADFHACPDSPEQDPVRLSAPAIAERQQRDRAEFQVICTDDQLHLPKPTSQGEQG